MHQLSMTQPFYIVWKVMYKLMAGQFDIETSFLYGDYDKEIWMEFPNEY